jgi:hypothetical protein
MGLKILPCLRSTVRVIFFVKNIWMCFVFCWQPMSRVPDLLKAGAESSVRKRGKSTPSGFGKAAGHAASPNIHAKRQLVVQARQPAISV